MVHYDVLALGGDHDLSDREVGALPPQGAEQQVLPGVSLHQVVASVPIDAAPHPLPGLEVVAGCLVDDVPVLIVVGLGDGVPADGARVAHLASATRIECGAVQDDLVAVHGDDVGLELEHVAVVPEYLIRHCIA